MRGHVLKQQGIRAKGGDGKKGEGVGEVGRLGASVRREESWEMQWRSNYGQHWSV